MKIKIIKYEKNGKLLYLVYSFKDYNIAIVKLEKYYDDKDVYEIYQIDGSKELLNNVLRYFTYYEADKKVLKLLGKWNRLKSIFKFSTQKRWKMRETEYGK